MSRALSKEVVTLLKSSDPSEAYKSVSHALTAVPANGKPLEIDILPSTYFLPPGIHVVHEEEAVGVSKFALLQAFAVARNILQKHRAGSLEHGQDDEDEDEVLRATAILLLTDAEHFTAANTRKRILLGKTKRISSEDVAGLIKRERCFIDSLLTSCLHRHTKSPTLWSHRRWLVQLQASLPLTDFTMDTVRSDIVDVVMRAGERHPRNYYAWSYARWLVETYLTGQGGTEACYEEILTATKRWCLRHHTDISGWTFLHYLLLVHRVATTAPVSKPSPDENIFSEVLELACSLKWSNESVWVFLRTLAAAGKLTDSVWGEFIAKNHDLRMRLDQAPDSQQKKALERAEAWAATYRLRREHPKVEE